VPPGEGQRSQCRLTNRSPLARRIDPGLAFISGRAKPEREQRRDVPPWIEDQTPSHWSDGASLTVVLLLSLGVWAGVWEAIASLASAVLP
jgi:hypothetical protein